MPCWDAPTPTTPYGPGSIPNPTEAAGSPGCSARCWVSQDRGATVLTDEARRGAAIWQRSDHRSLGVLGNLHMATAIIAGGARLDAARR